MLTETPNISPSPAEVIPVLSVAEPPSGLSFNIMLITPAIASEPYCADAPSLNTWMSLIASIGIPEISEPVSPLPGEVCVYNNADKFLRLPLISIKVLLGPMFLISYGSNKEVASFTGVCTVLKDGILYCNALSKVV